MVLEFFRQIPNCSGVHRRSSPGYRGSFSPPVSNDTDSRSSLSERTVKRVASRYLERARKSGDFSFLRCFFCIFVPVAGKNRNSDVFCDGYETYDSWLGNFSGSAGDRLPVCRLHLERSPR